jgi:hypothetical protein
MGCRCGSSGAARGMRPDGRMNIATRPHSSRGGARLRPKVSNGRFTQSRGGTERTATSFCRSPCCVSVRAGVFDQVEGRQALALAADRQLEGVGALGGEIASRVTSVKSLIRTARHQTSESDGAVHPKSTMPSICDLTNGGGSPNGFQERSLGLIRTVPINRFVYWRAFRPSRGCTSDRSARPHSSHPAPPGGGECARLRPRAAPPRSGSLAGYGD